MKFNMKKLAAALLLAAMVLGLCACGPDNGPGGNVQNPGEAVTVTGPVTIEFWHTRGGEHGTLLDAQIKKFNETNQYGITVVGTYQGSYYDVLSKTKTAYNTNMAPTMVLVGAGGIEELAENGALADMHAYVERDNWDIENIPESLRYYMEHYDGQIIEFPYLVSSAIIYYNKAYYSAEPTSLEEFVQMAENVTKNNPGVTGMGYVLDTGFIQRPILRSLGAPGLTLAGGDKPALLEDNYLTTLMNDWNSWIEKGFCATVDVTNSGTIMKNDFINGKLAAYVASSATMIDMINDCKANSIDLGVAKFVGYGGYCAPIGGGGIGVLANASAQEVAASWEFIKFLYEDEQVVENATSTGYLPYTYSAGKHEDMIAYWNTNPVTKVAYDQLEYATYNEWSVYLEQWRDKIAAAFSYVITDKSMTAEQAMNFLRTQAGAIFP